MFNAEHYQRVSTTVDNSFLVMRNQVVHGGGISTIAANKFVLAHNARLEEMLRLLMTVLRNVQIFSLGKDNILELVGVEPEKKNNPPKELIGLAEGPWLYP